MVIGREDLGDMDMYLVCMHSEHVNSERCSNNNNNSKQLLFYSSANAWHRHCAQRNLSLWHE